jgi:SpoVK/Ycf46/Vps4 family AAA+-type ATPase
MGQAWLGPAILHHLEGFHVQSLDLGTLMGDSARTIEAGLVQLFVEAKRHQPSVIFIPSLIQWSAAISDTARSTLKALLDGVPASDPILILALVDGELRDLPRDVRGWFGLGKVNRLSLENPSTVRPPFLCAARDTRSRMEEKLMNRTNVQRISPKSSTSYPAHQPNSQMPYPELNVYSRSYPLLHLSHLDNRLKRN